MLMFSRDMYSNLTKSFCCTVASGPLGLAMYPGLAMLEKAWGTTCGVVKNLLSTTLYQLLLCGGMLGNFPISIVCFVSLVHLVHSGGVRDQPPSGVLLMEVCRHSPVCRRRGSRPKAKSSL